MSYKPSSKQNPFPPIRKIPRKSSCYRGFLPSVAMGDQIIYESRSVEEKLYRFLDFLSILGLVMSIHPQPFEIEYRSGLFYHPDVLVTFRFRRLKPWLIDGKGDYFDLKRLQELKTKYRAAIGFARKRGYIFHLVTTAELRMIDNDILPFLATHRGKHVTPIVRDAVLKVLKQFGPLSPDDVSRYCRDRHHIDVPVQSVWCLAADGAIFCDLRSAPSRTVVAAPVPINISVLSRKILFLLPFCLIEREHDPLLRR